MCNVPATTSLEKSGCQKFLSDHYLFTVGNVYPGRERISSVR